MKTRRLRKTACGLLSKSPGYTAEAFSSGAIIIPRLDEGNAKMRTRVSVGVLFDSAHKALTSPSINRDYAGCPGYRESGSHHSGRDDKDARTE